MMATLNPVITQRLVHYGQAVQQAAHGQKTAIYREAANELGMATSTVISHIGKLVVNMSKPRKRRTDAGQSALTLQEAMLISMDVMEHMRKNGKRIMSMKDAVEELRANGLIKAERVSADGEIVPMSVSAIVAALRTYRLHPDQLLAPAPAIRMASLHPNHCWQIDASRCVMYYLPAQGKDSGLRVADWTEFYDNKPKNLARQVMDSLWRYVVTDHTSGAIFVWYVIGGETGGNLAEVLIQAIHQRGSEPFYGVPRMVMLDPGGANTSPPFLNLCKTLRVHVQINKPKNPRAKGQVEKGQDIVERSLESAFKLLTLETLEQINAVALQWARWFNATQIHTRHDMPRFTAWMRITPDQLVIGPGIELCRELAVSAPESRIVNDFLEVEFGGQTWDVSSVPNVIVGQKLMIVRNAWRKDSAQAMGVDAEGRECFYVLELKERNEFGFHDGAAVIGETYKRHADTPAQKHMQEIELLATGATTVTEAAAVRKAMSKGKGPQVMGGAIDPLKRMQDAVIPSYLPRKGTELEVHNPLANEAVLTEVETTEAIQRIAKRIGRYITREENRFIKGRWPKALPEEQIEALVAQFTRGEVAEQPEAFTGLRAVGGA
ncbi:integrase [Comamonas thiooxydans]|uniref:integrase n=1 Tax=Comamonas thiooxydans TaxID=363952 RepID=UPI000B2EE089|nr:integrase [Comamonas thiooxydans]